MPYYRSTAYITSQGFQKVHICYFMIFLLIATIFQSSAQKSAIKRLNRKKKTLLHWEPWTLLKSTKPVNVTSCVWLFYKVNTLKSFYLRSDPSSFQRGRDGRRAVVAGSADRRGASASRGGEGEAGRWCSRASRGQPEPRLALGSASRGCRRAG